MLACAPHARDAERLLGLLEAYDRTGAWLRIWQHFDFTGQPDQVWLEVVDANGVALADRSGRVRTHRLDGDAPWLPIIPGRSVHLLGEGESVWMHLLPMASGVVLGDFFGGPGGHLSA